MTTTRRPPRVQLPQHPDAVDREGCGPFDLLMMALESPTSCRIRWWIRRWALGGADRDGF
jgi:hypothetical protein